jgi:hypothetical protein
MLYDEPQVSRARVVYSRRRLLGRAVLLALVAAGAVGILQFGRVARALRAGAFSALNAGALKTDDSFTQADPSQPQVGPGVPQVGSNAPRSSASSSKAGSLLFFQKYTSDTSKVNDVNTLITITNTNPRDSAIVRVFFVHDGVFEDQFITLVANQSRTLLASKESPNMIGYVMAVAVNSQGAPTQFNWLIGAANLKDDLGHQASYNAFAVAKRSAGPVNFNENGQSASVKLDNTDYDRLPKTVAVDSLQNQDPSTGPAARTDVTLFSPLTDLTAPSPAAYTVTAKAYNGAGAAFIQDVSVNFALQANVTQIWTDTPFNKIISANSLGWANFSARSAAVNAPLPIPVLGLSLTDGVGAPMRNARNMQVLEWLDSFAITISARIPENPVADVTTQDQPEAPNGAQGASETKAGSFLLYPRFVSGANGKTQIYLTNTHPSQKIRARVFFTGMADPAQVSDTTVSLNASQTVVLKADDFAPEQRGWVGVMAIDSRSLPIQFNYLIGSAQVNETGGQLSALNAIAIAKNTSEAAERDEDGTTASLLFNDETYDRWPATTGLAFVPSQVDNSASLGYSRPANSLLDPPNARGSATVTLYDELLASFSASVARTENKLNQIRPSVLQPPITNTLLPGQHGWLKLQSSTPILSWSVNAAVSPFAVSGVTWRGGIGGAGSLHTLTTTDSFTLKVPASNPNNRAPVAIAESLGVQIEARRGDGTVVRLDGSGSSDEDAGDILTYEWADNGTLIATAPIADRKLGLGTHVIKLVVTDSSGVASQPAEQTVAVVDTTAPQISGVPSAIGKVTDSDSGEAINFTSPVAYDMVDGDVTVTASRASGSTFPIGKTVVTFVALDKAGNKSQATLEITLTKGAPAPPVGGATGDKAPTMGNIDDQYVKIGEVRSVALQAADADGDGVTFSLQGAPSYAQIIGGDPGARSATLRIAPQLGDAAASTNVRVIVSDGKGQTFTTLPFRILISDFPNNGDNGGPKLNRPPVAVVAALPSSVEATSKDGADVTLDGSASSDPDGDTLLYMWYDDTALIAEGPTATVKLAPGIHTIRLFVFDGKDGLTGSAPATLEVTPRPLTLISVSPSRLTRNTSTTLTVVGTGFTPGSVLVFGKDGISVTNYVSIAEDKIVANIVVSASATPSFRDIYVVNPNGKSVRLRSGLYVNP